MQTASQIYLVMDMFHKGIKEKQIRSLQSERISAAVIKQIFFLGITF